MGQIAEKAQAVIGEMIRLGFLEDSETQEDSFPWGAEKGGPLPKKVDELQKAYPNGRLPAKGLIRWKSLLKSFRQKKPKVYDNADRFIAWLEGAIKEDMVGATVVSEISKQTATEQGAGTNRHFHPSTPEAGTN